MRQPAVANRFYPGSSEELERTINKLLPPEYKENRQKAIAVISPHAGYIYSGKLAAKTLSSIEIPETVVIIGVNHSGAGPAASLSSVNWAMPLGPVPVDTEFSKSLLANSALIVQDETAHTSEHSLEVQLPFLQYLRKDISIVPLLVSRITLPDCLAISDSLAETVRIARKDVLIVASTDMSHYETRKNAEKKDQLALSCIEEMNPEKLYRTVLDNSISMCGFLPVTIALAAAKTLGATTARLIGYTDSGYVSGDTEQVVGYAGFTIS